MFSQHGNHHDKIEDEIEMNFRRLNIKTDSLSEKIDKINRYFMDKQTEPQRIQGLIDDLGKRLTERLKTSANDFTLKLTDMTRRCVEIERTFVQHNRDFAEQQHQLKDLAGKTQVLQKQLVEFDEHLQVAKRAFTFEQRINEIETKLFVHQ